MWELDHKERWALKNWCFWTVVLDKTLYRVPWIARRSKQSILKETNPEYSLKRLMLKLKLQCFGQLLGNIEGQEEMGQQRVRWLDPSLTRWTWVWASCGSWWWTGRPDVLQSTGRRIRHSWVTELKCSLYILKDSSLSDVAFANVFSHPVACLQNSLEIVFCRAEVFKFW